MLNPVTVRHLSRADADGGWLAVAQAAVTHGHYLRKPVDPRSSPEAFGVFLPWSDDPIGYLIVGRPEATRCGGWYGSLADVESGWAECSRWAVLNVARVYLGARVQGKTVATPDGPIRAGGKFYRPDLLPGFTDRHDVWRSTLASDALRALAGAVSAGYLTARPPCFLDEPYDVRWLLSYCDTRLHRGTIYRAADWELYHGPGSGRPGGGESGTIQTWRTPVAPLAADERAAVVEASRLSPRSIAHRARRAQTSLAL